MAYIILENANVITMDPVLPRARSILIENGKIVSVSAGESPREDGAGRGRIIDCRGRTVVPGFIDAHCHLAAYAESFISLDVGRRDRVQSIMGMQDEIRSVARALPPGSWIRGRGYNEFYLAEKRHPTRWDLDRATTVHPVKITHRSGHAHVLNSLALKLVGITAETGDPPEGLIDREARTGEPTGLLYGMGDILAKKVPPLRREEIERGVASAGAALSAHGVTSIHDASAGNGVERWKMFQGWKERGLLKQRMQMVLGVEAFLQGAYGDGTAHRRNGVGLCGVKIMLNETTGRISPGPAELDEIVARIHRSGVQAILHAVDEKTVRAACAAIGHALRKSPRPGHRHRIEHCSVCPPALARRIASLGVVVVTQPAFIYHHGERYLRTVPARDLRHLYPLATLVAQGVTVAGSSDCPIVPPDVLIGIYAAASRKAETGDVVAPEERVSPFEALRMYTENAARATFEESVKGSIAPGKVAELAILSGDPTGLPADEIKDIRVEMTIIDGEVAWEK